MTLEDQIRNRRGGMVLYGIVPPKRATPPETVAAIAARQRQRLSGLPIDGLVVYDLQDEQARTAERRPFPFLETLDPLQYTQAQLAELAVPKIIYRAVGKYSPDQLSQDVDALARAGQLSVFVGAASRSQSVALSLSQAYGLWGAQAPAPLLGGVTIPERHQQSGDEHLRLLSKMARGCSFFISQGVYDLDASRNLLSDYHYTTRERGIDPVPIIFTFTPCGSHKTLQFMKWLGISIPRWLENELVHAHDILEQSLAVCEANFRQLQAFASEKGLPIGCNIESVAVRKVEVEASIELVRRVAGDGPRALR